MINARLLLLLLTTLSFLAVGAAAAWAVGPLRAGPAGPVVTVQHRAPATAHRAYPKGRWAAPVHRGRTVVVPPGRTRFYRHVAVVRPYGHAYPGYGVFITDRDAYEWLAFTAIALKSLDLLSEAQQRAHEAAQVDATTAAAGETIVWRDNDASGAVTVLRDGTSTAGRYCREFRQTVTIGGRTEEAYGTACRQPDGAWEIVATGD